MGYSDFSRKEIEEGRCGWTIGASPNDVMSYINAIEQLGYNIEFKTNLWIRLFCAGKYKIIVNI